jgi:hypothetical protein
MKKNKRGEMRGRCREQRKGGGEMKRQRAKEGREGGGRRLNVGLGL